MDPISSKLTELPDPINLENEPYSAAEKSLLTRTGSATNRFSPEVPALSDTSSGPIGESVPLVYGYGLPTVTAGFGMPSLLGHAFDGSSFGVLFDGFSSVDQTTPFSGSLAVGESNLMLDYEYDLT